MMERKEILEVYNKEDDGEELGRESIWKRMEIVRRIMMRK